jgi:hypothetical protein
VGLYQLRIQLTHSLQCVCVCVENLVGDDEEISALPNGFG